MKEGIRNGILILLLIPLVYLLAVFEILPSYTLLPQVIGGISFVVIIIAVTAAQFQVFANLLSHNRVLKRYEPLDPSTYSRAVRDGKDGVEYLITGNETTPFRKACLANWQFENVDRKSDWIVVDERGNDVSNEPLSRFDGVFTLFDILRPAEPADRTEEYSSIHDSVEYYD